MNEDKHKESSRHVWSQ